MSGMSAIYKKILVPLDGSEFATRALPHAKELGRRYDAELVLFQSVNLQPRYTAAGDPGAMTAVAVIPDSGDLTHEVEAGKRALEGMAGDLRAADLEVHTAVEVGNPAECIVDYAVENKIDLIVMSTHGRTGLARWAFGSVAGKVIHAAKCPVLMIRPTE